MKLSREQRARLLAGDYSPLRFDDQPDFGKGAVYVLSRSRGEPVWWLEVTEIVRRRQGGFTVRFRVVDNRQTVRLVRSRPPRWDPVLMARDQTRPPTSEEVAQAAEESAYTSNPVGAVDHLEAVPQEDQRRQSEAAWERFAASAGERLAQRRADAARRSQPARWAEVRRLAKMRGVDISSHERVIEERLRRAERMVEGLTRENGEEAA